MHISTIQEASASQRHLIPPGTSLNDICMVCQLHKITFEPPLMYCVMCGLKIKRGQVFYGPPDIQGESDVLKVRSTGDEGRGRRGSLHETYS